MWLGTLAYRVLSVHQRSVWEWHRQTLASVPSAEELQSEHAPGYLLRSISSKGGRNQPCCNNEAVVTSWLCIIIIIILQDFISDVAKASPGTPQTPNMLTTGSALTQALVAAISHCKQSVHLVMMPSLSYCGSAFISLCTHLFLCPVLLLMSWSPSHTG